MHTGAANSSGKRERVGENDELGGGENGSKRQTEERKGRKEIKTEKQDCKNDRYERLTDR